MQIINEGKDPRARFDKYQPLRWPPDLNLAKMHMRCVCPGKDDLEGMECPCCGRLEKVEVQGWYCRDIFKDFKSYGGGIPCYFSLIKYCVVTLFILAIIVNLYHTVLLVETCPKIYNTLKTCTNYSEQQLQAYKCQKFLYIFYIAESKIINQTLTCLGQERTITIYFYLQLFSFLYLVSVTIGMKLWVQRTNSMEITKHQKLFSLFALILKNIPKYYSIQDLRKDILKLVPEGQICQLFFLHEIAELETQFKNLFDLHYQIQYKKQEILNNKGDKAHELEKMVSEYRKLFQKFQQLKNNMLFNNGRAIVVFNKVQHRDHLHEMVRINQCTKLAFNLMKMLSINTRNLHFFSDPLPEPKEVIWKYIGESEVTKNWFRVRTTMIGFGFMLLAFAFLYYPIIWIDQKNALQHSKQITILAIFISFLLKSITISYRLILLKLLPSRQPSSRQNQSYFITMSTIVFHFFFYIIAPGTYFVVSAKVPANVKLKQLFITILFFLIFTVLLALYDFRYRLFKGRREDIMASQAGWGKFCQVRLHEELRWPSFPIQFKLMVLFDIWSFNAFYIFQVPYLLLLFCVTLVILYWNDKRVLYKHYKMQVYQSIDIEISIQRDYIYMFLICVSCGYAVSSRSMWLYIFIGIVFVFAVIVNYIISYKKSEELMEKIAPLVDFIKAQSINLKRTFSQTMLDSQLKHNLIFVDQKSTDSVGSESIHCGYREVYETYLKQFKNPQIIKLLMETNDYISNPDFSLSKQLNQQHCSFWMSRTKLFIQNQNPGNNSLYLENTEKSRMISDLSSESKSRQPKSRRKVGQGIELNSMSAIEKGNKYKQSNFYMVIEHQSNKSQKSQHKYQNILDHHDLVNDQGQDNEQSQDQNRLQNQDRSQVYIQGQDNHDQGRIQGKAESQDQEHVNDQDQDKKHYQTILQEQYQQIPPNKTLRTDEYQQNGTKNQ